MAAGEKGSSGPIELSGEPATFEKLRELTRNGYVPAAEQAPSTGGILLRHPSAPDLVLLPDGRIELPLGRPEKPAAPAPRPERRDRISWRRTIVVTVLVTAIWLLSVFVGLILTSIAEM